MNGTATAHEAVVRAFPEQPESDALALEVGDGKITVWRDAFDFLDCTKSLVRGLAGAVSPGLNRRWPPSR